jgi:hypothetical protein
MAARARRLASRPGTAASELCNLRTYDKNDRSPGDTSGAGAKDLW